MKRTLDTYNDPELAIIAINRLIELLIFSFSFTTYDVKMIFEDETIFPDFKHNLIFFM